MAPSCSRLRLSFLLVFFGADKALSFVRHAAFQRRSAFFPPLELQVFMPDDSTESWEELEALDEKGQSLGLSDLLSMDQMASLARLAVAFSPPERALSLKDIQDVHVLDVDESHIFIQAVVCESGGCVTLAVPVDFPSPCSRDSGNSVEQCVLENIGVLDRQAEDRIRELEWEAEHAEEDDRTWQTLLSTKDMDLPSWWEFQPALTAECDNICTLLNEASFRQEIKALGTKVLGNEELHVQKAAIASVCPSGLYLRALVSQGNEKPSFVGLALPFERPAADSESLRAAVLNTVMSASSYKA